MNLEYQESTKFEKDLRSLDASVNKKVVTAIIKMGNLAQVDRAAFFQKVLQPKLLKMHPGLDSTLYTMKVQGAPHLRIIFTLDDDPLFDRVIMTLLRVVHHDTMEKTYMQLAHSLYRGMMESESDANG